MVDFGESDKMIKIGGKVIKSNTYHGFTGNISFFIHRTNKERNITTKPVVSVWFIHFPLMVDMPLIPTKPNHIYSIYMYKEDLTLNNLQWLICH